MRMAAKSGYTIIEVLIVLAISTSLLFAAIAIFKGQQDETEFTQVVQDLNSKVINYANQVSAGTFPESEEYTCNGGTPRPTLALASGKLGGRQGCIFLGRAIQFSVDSGNVNVYTILGKQTDASGDPVTDIADASAEPSIRTDTCNASISDCWVLTDSFDLASSVRIKSAVLTDTLGNTPAGWMAGIYTALDQNSGPTTGILQQMLWGYQMAGNAGAFSTGGNGVKGCIENTGQAGGCTNMQIAKWGVCIQNPNGNHTFLMTIQGSTTGVSTSLTDNGC